MMKNPVMKIFSSYSQKTTNRTNRKGVLINVRREGVQERSR
jgi:hypothetical protein